MELPFLVSYLQKCVYFSFDICCCSKNNDNNNNNKHNNHWCWSNRYFILFSFVLFFYWSCYGFGVFFLLALFFCFCFCVIFIYKCILSWKWNLFKNTFSFRNNLRSQLWPKKDLKIKSNSCSRSNTTRGSFVFRLFFLIAFNNFLF